MKLTIGFDGKRAVNNMTGLGNYSRLVIDALADIAPDWQFLLYCPAYRENGRLKPILEAHDNIRVVTPRSVLAKSLKPAWRTWGITRCMKRDSVDIYHGLSNELPLDIRRSGVASVVTVHDLIYRTFPSNYSAIDREIYDFKYRRSAETATRVIAVSRRTRDDLVSIYGIDPQKIDVVYQGCDQQFCREVSDAEVEDVKRKYGLDHPYVIGVGTVELRKNQLLTVKALRALPADIHAVIVGRNKPEYAKVIHEYISRHGLEARVHFLENVPFADFPALYRGALVSSYPSRYEGFGIPVIESINAGTPVVVASGSCLEEAAGPGAPVIDPDSDEALAHEILRLVEDENYRRLMLEAGRRHVAQFNPAEFTRGIIKTYTEALAQNGK